MPLPCVNHAVCRSVCDRGGICTTCELLNVRPIRLVSEPACEPCAVCFAEDGPRVEFPTQCGHAFCIDCTRKLVFATHDEFVSPAEFGGPASPENEILIREWAKERPEDHARWVERSVGTWRDSVCSVSRTCPLCRMRIRVPARTWWGVLRRDVLREAVHILANDSR